MKLFTLNKWTLTYQPLSSYEKAYKGNKGTTKINAEQTFYLVCDDKMEISWGLCAIRMKWKFNKNYLIKEVSDNDCFCEIESKGFASHTPNCQTWCTAPSQKKGVTSMSRCTVFLQERESTRWQLSVQI